MMTNKTAPAHAPVRAAIKDVITMFSAVRTANHKVTVDNNTIVNPTTFSAKTGPVIASIEARTATAAVVTGDGTQIRAANNPHVKTEIRPDRIAIKAGNTILKRIPIPLRARLTEPAELPAPTALNLTGQRDRLALLADATARILAAATKATTEGRAK